MQTRRLKLLLESGCAVVGIGTVWCLRPRSLGGKGSYRKSLRLSVSRVRAVGTGIALATAGRSVLCPSISDTPNSMPHSPGRIPPLHTPRPPTTDDQVEVSLRRLQTTYIDILYLHSWDHTPIPEVMHALNASYAPAWFCISGLRLAGMVRRRSKHVRRRTPPIPLGGIVRPLRAPLTLAKEGGR